jgi:hypothetical protein
MIDKPTHYNSVRLGSNQPASPGSSSSSLLTLGRWRCAIRSPFLRRAGALVFGIYLLKGFAWLGFAAWLWWSAT